MSLGNQTLDIGVLMLSGFQWLDAVGPVDFLNNHSQTLLKSFQDLSLNYQLPQSIVENAPIIQWHWISHDLNPVNATSGPPQTPTCTYTTAPKLDYIIVPGPDPLIVLPAGCTEFLQGRFPELKGLLTVCTGSLAISPTGLLDGLQVCSNKVALQLVAAHGKLYKEVKWVGDRRWIRDGKVWSAAGITAGIDLAAEFARVNFSPEVVELAKAFSEYTPRPDQPDEWAKILEGVDLGRK